MNHNFVWYNLHLIWIFWSQILLVRLEIVLACPCFVSSQVFRMIFKKLINMNEIYSYIWYIHIYDEFLLNCIDLESEIHNNFILGICILNNPCITLTGCMFSIIFSKKSSLPKFIQLSILKILPTTQPTFLPKTLPKTLPTTLPTTQPTTLPTTLQTTLPTTLPITLPTTITTILLSC